MSQPDMLAITEEERAPQFWAEEVDMTPLARPAELRGRRLVTGALNGRPGPDQGYALSLLTQLLPTLVLDAAEQPSDVASGLVACAMAIAARNGRAPIARDLEEVASHFSFHGEASPETLATRIERFRGVAHDYQRLRRAVALTEMELSLQG